MNCHDVAAILDTHRSARLSAAERSTVDGHLTACEDCAAAWHAQAELLGLSLPRVPTTLLERALLAARVPPIAQPRRRAWAPLTVGAALLAGAALAGVTLVSLTRSPSAGVPPSTDGEPSAQTAEALLDVAAPAAAPAANASRDLPTSVELVETSLGIAPIVRRGPDYPPALLAEGVQGHVQVKFDVTAAGTVENPTVVESSDARFEESALRAVSAWRYLPRIMGGKRAAAKGIHTVIRFALGNDTSPPDPRRKEKPTEAVRVSTAFSSDLEIALERLASDDLRGAELQLDEMLAVYASDGFYADLWNFYGYLFTVQGHYDRAIDAYETALAAFARSGSPASGPWVPLANLYFARHQYDLALNTLAAYRDRVAAVQAANPGRPLRPLDDEAVRLVERLRALGVSDEALPRAR
jgi:TonB family protein